MGLQSPENYINRELSWLEFNHRVLLQALAGDNPVFERMKFLSIVISNLDEFFMIRVAGLRHLVNTGCEKRDPAGMTPKEQLSAISKRAHELMDTEYAVYRSVLAELELRGISVITASELNEEQLAFCGDYFDQTLYPLITPIAVQQGTPFPLIPGRSLNLGVLCSAREGKQNLFIISIPSGVDRLLPLPCKSGNVFIPVEEVVRLRLSTLFPNASVLSSGFFRITRNGDLSLDDDAVDLLGAVKKSLRQRQKGEVVRLEISADAPDKLINRLRKHMSIQNKDIYRITGPINLNFLTKQLYDISGNEDACYKPFEQNLPQELCVDESIFDTISRGDILLYHPFDSFDPVVRLLSESADDPDVMSIKITLYRVSHNSPIVEALERAAKNGKQVFVLIEARARFDEQNNIEFGEELSKSGATVIYGLPKLKTHSKIALVLRRERGLVKKYLHLGTGNYNDVTARIYTDYSLLTANQQLGSDAVEFFHSVTGGLPQPQLSGLVMAPYELRTRFVNEMKLERRIAKQGGKGFIFAKMNSLTDPDIIKELYKTSQAGVKIQLIVRGICCLRPGIPGVSDNIEVRSIVGRFLEHSRVYCFGEGIRRRIYLSSADWMTRNLDKRVELLFPIFDTDCIYRIQSDLELYWNDTAKGRTLSPDGSYHSCDDSGVYINAQEELIPYKS
ncbi:MAG: polyphosphate kinase 1 [Clostridia bacterium]|nr:polyphosphate kinase 1 [Clostridia bacterium]